jgi:hypothetical protein
MLEATGIHTLIYELEKLRGVTRFDHNSYKSRELGRVTNMLKHTLNLDKNAELKLESPCTCTFFFVYYISFITLTTWFL